MYFLELELKLLGAEEFAGAVEAQVLVVVVGEELDEGVLVGLGVHVGEDAFGQLRQVVGRESGFLGLLAAKGKEGGFYDEVVGVLLFVYFVPQDELLDVLGELAFHPDLHRQLFRPHQLLHVDAVVGGGLQVDPLFGEPFQFAGEWVFDYFDALACLYFDEGVFGGVFRVGGVVLRSGLFAEGDGWDTWCMSP